MMELKTTVVFVVERHTSEVKKRKPDHSVVNSKCQPLLVCFQAETAESSNEKTSASAKGSWYSATARINLAP